MYHSLYMWKSCSEPTPYGPHIGCRRVKAVQGGILADYHQIDTHVLKWNSAKFGYPKSLHIRAIRDWVIPSKLRFDAIYPSVAIPASRQFKAAYWLITTEILVIGGTLLTKNFSFHREREIMYPSLYKRKSCSEPTPYGPILAVVVSRQSRAAYWLITTKLILMSWREILQSLVILSLFTFELYVIEIFLQNSVLMLYIRRWPSWRHASSGRHIGWLRPKL